MEAHFPNVHRYDQLCQSLLCLDEAVDKIFNTISNRIAIQHQQLNSLQRRIKLAQAKVNALSGTNKAITIFSSSKYPVNLQDKEDFLSLFGGKMDGVEFPVAKISLSTGLFQVGGEGTLELYHFFTETNSELEFNLKAHASLPAKTKSVSDTTLSNSLGRPCFKLNIMDKLAEAEKQQIDKPSKKAIILHDPPQSVLLGVDKDRLGSNDFGFRPIFHEVPTLSLPSVLPSLAMVAEISWNGSGSGVIQLPSIAPSAVRSGLPKYSADSTFSKSSSLVSPTESIIASTKTVQIRDKPSIVSLSPPPPPPPPLPSTAQKVAASDAANSPKDVATLSSTTTGQPAISDARSYKKSSSLPESSAESLPLIDPQREALLASIRHRNFSLRKTGFGDYGKESSQSVIRAEQNGSSTKLRQPADLLAEMATSLKMRRLSMQGAAHDKAFLKSGTGTSEVGSSASPSSSSGKFILPIANLHAYIAKKNEEISDDDEWDD